MNTNEITIKELLARILVILNSTSEKKYILNCFTYNNTYEYIGTRHDYPLGGETRKEKFIALTTEGYDTEHMFCGFLNYPDEYTNFYAKGDFILIARNVTDFAEALESTIELDKVADYLRYRFGLPKNVKDMVLKDLKPNKKHKK